MFFVTGPQPRMYALRRIKSRFQENKTLKDPVLVEFYINDGKNNVDIIRRQVSYLSVILHLVVYWYLVSIENRISLFNIYIV